MRIIIANLFFLLTLLNANAQIGISGTYNQIKTPDWSPVFEQSTLYDFGQAYHFPNTTGIAIDYWMRPLPVRIEVLPTLSYLKTGDSRTTTNPATTLDVDIQLIDLSLPIHFYLLDLEGDCDCPTWGKEGSVVKKGFYLSLAPGISFFDNKSVKTIPTLRTENHASHSTFHLGVGAGLDIGLTDFFTLTPFVYYKRHFKNTWEILQEDLVLPSEANFNYETIANQLTIGIRLGIHYKK